MSARGWALFAAVSVIWGMPYLFIKIAVDELSPSVVAWSRLALAAAVLLPIAWRLGALRGLGERWRILALFAAVEMAVPWPLIGYGEVHISSSLAAILIAAVPLFVALLALRFDHAERPTATRLAGMLIGLAGVVALVGIDIGGQQDDLLGALAILVAAFCYAVGPMIVKRRLSDVDPLGPVAASLAIATVLVTPFALADVPTDVPSGDVIASIAVLGVVCSALAFLFFFRLIAEVGPSRRHRDHLREPGRGAGTGRGDPRRERDHRRRRRAAADPGRVVAVHGWKAAARPRGARRAGARQAAVHEVPRHLASQSSRGLGSPVVRGGSSNRAASRRQPSSLGRTWI